MNQRRSVNNAVRYLPLSLACAGLACALFAQEPAQERVAKKEGTAKKAPGKQQRAKLLFREEWKQFPPGGEHPMTQEGVASPNLEIKLYGPAAKDIRIFGEATDETNPTHLWTGLCEATCAAAIRDKNGYIDLSGLGRVRWYVKMAGFHLLRPIVKLADGTWLVGDHTDGLTADWIESEFTPSALRWRKLDIKAVTEAPDGKWLDNPDLSKVEEFGFTDLMRGSGHGPGGWSDVGWIEVYGKSVPRE